MKRILSFILVFSTSLFYFSCEETENEFLINSSDIIAIEYGTSFGHCVGYCINSIEITGTDIEFHAFGWTTIDKVPEINISGDIPQKTWDTIVQKIDLVVFRNLDEVIGCPDCADGGAEWVKITTDKFVHKVVFEHSIEPEEIKEYIDDLRSLTDHYLELVN